MPQTARRRKLYVYADQIGLTPAERVDVAELILRRDFASWNDLDDGQVDRMLDALEGFLLVTYQLSLRGYADLGPKDADRFVVAEGED
jgi:hypothetical protein